MAVFTIADTHLSLGCDKNLVDSEKTHAKLADLPKDAEEAKKTAEQKRENAKAAQVVAAQAEANAEKARKIPIVGDISRFVDTERSAWDNYLNKANKLFSDFKVGVKDRNRAFIKGIKTSGSRKFDDTRKFLPRIQSEALTDEVVRSLVVAATKDAISNDKQNSRLTNEIKKLIVGANFIPLCKSSYEKLYDDGRMLEDYYNRELSQFKANLVQKRTESGLTTDIGTKTEKHASDFPKQIPPSIQETIDKSSTAVARLVLRLGKAEISEMRKVFDRNGDTKNVNVSALRTKLGSKVENELGAIVDKLQAKALDDVIQKANRSFSNSIKEGEQFFRDAPRIQR